MRMNGNDEAPIILANETLPESQQPHSIYGPVNLELPKATTSNEIKKAVIPRREKKFVSPVEVIAVCIEYSMNIFLPTNPD